MWNHMVFVSALFYLTVISRQTITCYVAKSIAYYRNIIVKGISTIPFDVGCMVDVFYFTSLF